MPITKHIRKLPHELQVVCHYANTTRVTPRNWRHVVLGPFRKNILPRGMDPPETPVFGVSSDTQLNQILDEYRALIRRIVKLESDDSPEAVEVSEMLEQRAGLQRQGLFFN